MSKSIFVDHNAFLSAILKIEENTGKSYDELLEQYHIKERLYSLTPNSHFVRQKTNLPLGSYFIAPLSEEEYEDMCERNSNHVFTIGIKIDEKEIKNLSIPDLFIYEVELIAGKYYQRIVHDKLILTYLSDIEIDSLEEAQKQAYLKHVQSTRYTLEYNNNGTVTLEVLHEDNPTKESYYVIDYPYDEQIDEFVTFLKACSNGNYRIEEKPQINKKHPILKYIFGRKGE